MPKRLDSGQRGAHMEEEKRPAAKGLPRPIASGRVPLPGAPGDTRSTEEGKAMTRVSPFNSPLLLGFDRLEEVVDRLTRSSTEGYPPYNVVHVGDERLRISLAVAGFDEDDLDVTVERNELHIRGRQAEENGAVYLYRGIAARQFHRTFLLADGIEIDGARLDNGLLHIELKRLAAPEIVRTVAIRSGNGGGQ